MENKLNAGAKETEKYIFIDAHAVQLCLEMFGAYCSDGMSYIMPIF